MPLYNSPPGAWISYVPTFTGLTTTSGTISAFYSQWGKQVMVRVGFVFGASSAVTGAVSISLPATSVSYSGTATLQILGGIRLFDTSVPVSNSGVVVWSTTTTVRIQSFAVTGALITQSDLSSTSPFTWATGDEFYAQFYYEAA